MRSSAVATAQNFCARFAALPPVELNTARREQLRASLRRKERSSFKRFMARVRCFRVASLRSSKTLKLPQQAKTGLLGIPVKLCPDTCLVDRSG
jgi:hypothetical protein